VAFRLAHQTRPITGSGGDFRCSRSADQLGLRPGLASTVSAVAQGSAFRPGPAYPAGRLIRRAPLPIGPVCVAGPIGLGGPLPGQLGALVDNDRDHVGVGVGAEVLIQPAEHALHGHPERAGGERDHLTGAHVADRHA
jgi:hypothetical protein